MRAAKGRAQHDTAAHPIVLTLAFVVLVLISTTSVFLVLRSQSDATSVAHTLEVENKLAELHALIRRADAGQRGYLLTGKSQYLDSYRTAIEAAPHAFADLAAATADNASQRREFAALEPVLQRKLADLREIDRLYDQGNRAAALALVRTGPGQVLAEQIRDAIDRMTNEERRLLDIRTAESRRTNLQLLAMSLFGTAMLISLAAISIFMVRRATNQREDALASLEAVNAGLEETIADRTRHLQTANEESRRTLDVLNNTLTSMADAVVVTDRNLNILLANPAASRILGLRDGIAPRHWPQIYRVFLPDEVTPVPFEQGAIARASRGDAVDDMEIFVRRVGDTDGTHLRANGRPLRDVSGAIVGTVMVYRDVTEAREIERRLRHAQKMDAIGQLTGGVAHDFNNILTVITGTIDILARAVEQDPKLTAVARMIDDAAERGSELTGRLLAFARRQPLRPRAVDINSLVINSAKLLRPTLGEQVEIESMLSEDTWPAQIDPSQLTTALLNLALNARDAMPDGGKLTLETGNVHLDQTYADVNIDVHPGPYVIVAVSDTGAGIPAALRDKVFEPFFTTKEAGKGTGLGLSMVYGFVKQSGGHIKIYSEEGHGTSVKLYLPRANEQAEQDAEASAPMPMGGDETILVVEDDPLVREYVTAQLQTLGYTTLAAESGTAALVILDETPTVDLLFTDVVMPGLNGRQLAEEVLKRQPGMKVLFTSGYTENAIVHHGRLDAGVLLLAKPYRKTDLARMVRVALDGTRSAGAAA